MQLILSSSYTAYIMSILELELADVPLEIQAFLRDNDIEI